jgi:signal transduction histidine kinase
LTAQELERKRISREIHDDLLQRLGILEIQLERMTQASAPEGRLGSELQALRSMVASLTDDLHRICYGLHPALLDTLGLAPAIEFLCEECTRMRGCEITFFQRGIFQASANESLCLYRVVQEALHNIAKHAHAEKASVLLMGSRHCIRVVIEDAGCGFDLTRKGVRFGLGLTSLRERVHLLGGRCEIWSSPGEGTRITVSVPVEAMRDGAETSTVLSPIPLAGAARLSPSGP